MIRSFLSWKKIGKSSVMPQQIRSRCTLKKRRMKTLSSLTRAGCLAGVMFVQMDSNEMLHISIEMIPWLGERFSDCTEPEVNYWDADYRQINATYTNKQNSHENVCVVFREWNKKKWKVFLWNAPVDQNRFKVSDFAIIHTKLQKKYITMKTKAWPSMCVLS